MNELQDLVFFNGSDISLHCETNCVQLQLSCTIFNLMSLLYLMEGRLENKFLIFIMVVVLLLVDTSVLHTLQDLVISH